MHSELMKEARTRLDGEEHGGEDGDEVVKEGVVKGGLLQVGEGQGGLDVLGCPPKSGVPEFISGPFPNRMDIGSAGFLALLMLCTQTILSVLELIKYIC